MATNIIIVMVALITSALCNPNNHQYTESCKPSEGYNYPNDTDLNYLVLQPLRPIERCCPCSDECKHKGGSCILNWAAHLYPKCCDFTPVEPCRDYSCVCCIRCDSDKCSPCVQTGGNCRAHCRTNELEDKTNKCSYYNHGSGCKCCKKCQANPECIEAEGICATDPEWCPYGTYASTGCCGGCYCCKPVWMPVIGGQCDSTDGAYCSETDQCEPGFYSCFGECFAAYYNGGHSRIEQGYCCAPKNRPTNHGQCTCELYNEGTVYHGRCIYGQCPHNFFCNGTCDGNNDCKCGCPKKNACGGDGFCIREVNSVQRIGNCVPKATVIRGPCEGECDHNKSCTCCLILNDETIQSRRIEPFFLN